MDFLEVKVSTIEKFIKEFIRNDPELSQVMNEKLRNLSKLEEDIPKNQGVAYSAADEMDPAHEEFIDDLLVATEDLRIDEETQHQAQPNVRQYTTELQDLIASENSEGSNIMTSTSTPISIIGLSLVFRDLTYSNYLIDLFDQNLAIHSMALRNIIPSIKRKNYNYINEPTIRLFMTCIYGIGSIFATHPNKKQHEQYFIAMARDSLMSITCKSKVDIYIILSIYLLSNYELGQGNLHQSYIMNAMACSLTQHMGLHISYDNDFENVNYAPKSSPLHSSILWSICLHDRLITSLVQVPCVIHFKRIISPFYKVSTSSETDLHISELSFAYLSRLWYIYDRYTDQIFSTNFDVGDTNNREKVLIMALKTLKELLNSLPIQLRLQSLDLDRKYDLKEQNLFILMFNFNYHVAVLQLNKIFIKENPNLSRKATVEAAIKAANILSILNKNEFPVDKLPYNFGYLVHSVSLVLLFILTTGHSKNLYKLKTETNIWELYQDSTEILRKFATNWPSAELHLNHLQRLGEKYDLEKACQTPSSRASSPLSKSIQSALEQINDDILNEQFMRESTTSSNSSTNNATSNDPNSNTNNTPNNLNSFQLFEMKFPMFGLNQQEPFATTLPYTNQETYPQSQFQQRPQGNTQIPLNPQGPQRINPPPFMNPQMYAQSNHQPPPPPPAPGSQIYQQNYQEAYTAYPQFHQVLENPQVQRFNPSSSSGGSDVLPLDEEFIHDAKVPDLTNINF